MKALFALMALVSLQNVHAQDYVDLKNGDKGLYPLSAEVVSVERSGSGSTVTLNVPLHGCLDRLGGYSTDFRIIDGVPTLSFTGVGIASESSKTTMCFRIPSEEITVRIPHAGEFVLDELIPLDKGRAISKGDISLSGAGARIISVSPTVVMVEVSMNGCMDRMGHYSYKFNQIGGTQVLTFSAVNIGNEASRYTRCIRNPTEIIKLVMPYKGPVEMNDLEFFIR